MFGRAAASHVGGRSAICAGRAHVRVPCGKPRQTVDPVPTAVRQAGRVGLGVKWERRSAVRCGQTRSCALIAAASTPLNCRNVVEQRLCALERSVRDEEVVGSNPATPTQVRGLLRSWLGLYRLTVQQLSSCMGPSQHIGRARPPGRLQADGVQQQPHKHQVVHPAAAIR
jgi:hypothetical protein